MFPPANLPVFSRFLQPPARYWPEQQKEGKDDNKVGKNEEHAERAVEQEEQKTQKTTKRKQEGGERDGKKFISGVRLCVTDSRCQCHQGSGNSC